jgi:ABC-type antimicrobial peptide transport system ATPase subunit
VKRLSDRFNQVRLLKLDMSEDRTEFGDIEIGFKAMADVLDEYQAEVEARLSAIKPAPVALKGPWWERTGSQRRRL